MARVLHVEEDLRVGGSWRVGGVVGLVGGAEFGGDVCAQELVLGPVRRLAVPGTLPAIRR